MINQTADRKNQIYRFTDKLRKTLTIRDVSPEEIFNCSICRKPLCVLDEHILLKNKNKSEELICLGCWEVVQKDIDWFFYYCAGIFGNSLISSECGKIVNGLFGSRFYYLHKIEHGYVLTDPVLKIEQPALFT